MSVLTPPGLTPQGEVRDMSESTIRAMAVQGAGKAKEMVASPGQSSMTAGLIMKISVTGSIQGSYLHITGPQETVPLHPRLFSIPEDMWNRISIQASINPAAFRFPGDRNPRNISNWLDGLQLLKVHQVKMTE